MSRKRMIRSWEDDVSPAPHGRKHPDEQEQRSGEGAAVASGPRLASSANKKRKSNLGGSIYSLASTVLYTAAEAVMLVTVLGMAAYKVWSRTDEEALQSEEKDFPEGNRDGQLPRHAPHRDPASELLPEQPPPYESVYIIRDPPMRATAAPCTSRSFRSPRQRHTVNSSKRRVVIPSSAPLSSPAKSSSSSALSPPSSASFGSASSRSPLFSSATSQTAESGSSIAIPSDPYASFAADRDREEDDDELFANMSSRLQDLIHQGTTALTAMPEHDNTWQEDTEYSIPTSPGSPRRHTSRIPKRVSRTGLASL